MTIRFGLIGFGAWGQCHAAAIAQTDGAELVAIAARTDKTCQAAREAYPQAEVFSDYRKLLDRDDLDIVDVVLPTHLHHEVASAPISVGTPARRESARETSSSPSAGSVISIRWIISTRGFASKFRSGSSWKYAFFDKFVCLKRAAFLKRATSRIKNTS